MATVQNYVTQAKYDAGVGDDQILDTKVLEFFNEIYHELENAIVNQLREYFFRGDLSLSNIVAGQNDYDLPIGTSTNNPGGIDQLKKLFAVYVKYDTSVNTEYFKATQLDLSNTQYDLPYYGANQPNTNPLFLLKGNKIQIFPTPSINVTNGLKIDYARSDIDLLLTSDESDLTIPWQYHKVIKDGVIYRIHRSREKVNEENNAYNFFLREKNRMLLELANRFIMPIEDTLPTGLLTNYMY